MWGEQTPRWIDSTRFPEAVIAAIEALPPGEDLFIVKDGVPIAKISEASGTFRVETSNSDENPSGTYDDVTVVATAMTLSSSARSTLSAQLGSNYIVLDMQSAPASAEVLLIPPLSPQLIGSLRQMFPKARVVIAEVEDRELGVVYEGPVRRLLDAGADVYFPPNTIPGLAKQLDRTIVQFNQIAAGETSAPLVIESAQDRESTESE
jgi:hypothetical protein